MSMLDYESTVQAAAKADAFRALHQEGPPLQLVNAWNVTSARVAAAAGASAIGTTSFGLSAHHGRVDGEQLGLTEVLAATAAIVDAVDVPVSLDLETGHGSQP